MRTIVKIELLSKLSQTAWLVVVGGGVVYIVNLFTFRKDLAINVTLLPVY